MQFSTVFRALIPLVFLSLAACDKKAEASASEGSASAKADCPYESKSGFCLAPPAGFELKEISEAEGVPGTLFEKSGEPVPGQHLFVMVDEVELPEEGRKQQREQFKSNAKVIEEAEIADGRGYYLLTEHPNNVMARAVVAGNGKTFTCTFNAYLKDRAALEPWLRACKSLRLLK
jgi:hypothetical protein